MVWLVILIVIILVITTHLVRQTGKRFREAARHEDIPAARQELAELRSLSRFLPSLRRLVQPWSVSLLLIEERYAEALPQITALCRKRTSVVSSQMVLNDLAWCLAHTGDPERGVEVAQVVMRRAEHMQLLDILPSALGTLGTAYCLASHPAQAVRYLERSLAIGTGDPRGQATRAYYLGESLRAMGKTEAAREAYQRACQEFPGSRFANRAQQRLDLC